MLLALLKQITDYKGFAIIDTWMELKNVSFVLLVALEKNKDASFVSSSLPWAFFAPEPPTTEVLAKILSSDLTRSSHALRAHKGVVERIAKASVRLAKLTQTDMAAIDQLTTGKIFEICSSVKLGEDLDEGELLKIWAQDMLVMSEKRLTSERHLLVEHFQDACSEIFNEDERAAISETSEYTHSKNPDGELILEKIGYTKAEELLETMKKDGGSLHLPIKSCLKKLLSPLTRAMVSHSRSTKGGLKFFGICGLPGSGRKSMVMLCSKILGFKYVEACTNSLPDVLQKIGDAISAEEVVLYIRIPTKDYSTGNERLFFYLCV
jgi:hypothetical protein